MYDPKDKNKKEKERMLSSWSKRAKGKGQYRKKNRGVSPKHPIRRSLNSQPLKAEGDIIKESRLLEAYELFMRAICKHGLPDGDVY